MALIWPGRRSSRASLRSHSVRLSPQSISTCVLPCSATRQFPLLPLPSDAKRNFLFQLVVEEREDALGGGRGLRVAVLVEDVDLAAGGILPDLHAELLGLDLGVLGAEREQAREHALVAVLLRHVGVGVGVAH